MWGRPRLVPSSPRRESGAVVFLPSFSGSRPLLCPIPTSALLLRFLTRCEQGRPLSLPLRFRRPERRRCSGAAHFSESPQRPAARLRPFLASSGAFLHYRPRSHVTLAFSFTGPGPDFFFAVLTTSHLRRNRHRTPPPRTRGRSSSRLSAAAFPISSARNLSKPRLFAGPEPSSGASRKARTTSREAKANEHHSIGRS